MNPLCIISNNDGTIKYSICSIMERMESIAVGFFPAFAASKFDICLGYLA